MFFSLYSQTADNILENNQNHPKRPSTDMGEEIIVNNIKFKRTNSNVSRRSTLSRDRSNSLTNLTVILSAREPDFDAESTSKSRKVTKHNSLKIFPSSRRLSAKRLSEVETFRRKSLSAFGGSGGGGGSTTPKENSLSRSSSKWSLYKDSTADAHWKGFRWKPFHKEEVYSVHADSLDAAKEKRSPNQVASFPDEFVYVNEAYRSSPMEELSASSLMSRNKVGKDEIGGEVTEFGKVRQKNGERKLTNVPSQDSLVWRQRKCWDEFFT